MGNYEKLNLVNGTPFAAEHVAHMEDGIAAVEAQATAVAGDVVAVAGNVAALGREVEELKKNPGTGGGEGGGASLPEAGPYQYLVTDGNGQWGTADRLAYEENQTLYKGYPEYLFQEAKIPGVVLQEGTEYTITVGEGDTALVITEKATKGDGEGIGIYSHAAISTGYADRFELFMGSDGICYLHPYSGKFADGIPEESEDGSYAYTSKYEITISQANVVPIDPAKWLPEGYPYGEEHSVVLSTSGGVAFEGEDKGEGAPSYYLVYAGNVSDAAWNNLTVTNPSGEQLIDADSEDEGNTRYFRDDNYYYTVLCRFDGNETVNNSSGNITPDAGIYWRTGYNEMGGNGFTVDFGFVQTMAPKFLPKSAAVADAAGETPTAAEFNALLTALRNAGYLTT